MKGAMNPSILLFSLLVVTWVNPIESNPGDDYLNDKESQVTRLQAQVQDNHRQQCELVASCATPGSCSRMSCWPLLHDVTTTTCQKVQNNSYCSGQASMATCPSKKFDFTKLYVRLAPTTSITAAETAITICSQRNLSNVFKDICSPTSLSRAFFGSVDGTYTHFPGSDQSAQDCGTYDPRPRPWYRISTSILAKAVMVLLDVGVSMGYPVTPPLQGTYLTTARDIVLELLNTLSEKDYVNVITFDSTNATSLPPSPVRVMYQPNSSYHPEFDGLRAKLSDKNLQSAILDRPSNISLGIAEALRNYALGFPMSMQVLVVFTDGNAANLKDGALAGLQGRNGTKVFIFKLPQPDDNNRFLANTPFLTQLSNMGGSFNVIISEAGNPLYSILPYFSFLANFQAMIKNSSSADYSTIYEDFEQVVDNTFSISKPAFDDAGNLVGVVGLNIFVDELGDLTASVMEALEPRTLSKAFDPSKIELTAANASIQIVDNPDNPCPKTTTPSSAGLCAQTDTVNTIQDLACCNACNTDTKANSTPKYIGIGVCVGGVAIAAIIFAVLVYLCRRPKENFRPYSGPLDPNEDVHLHTTQSTMKKASSLAVSLEEDLTL